MQIPQNEKTPLNLMQGYITFQIFLNTSKSFTIEIAITDICNIKKRLLISTCSKEFIINQLHCRIPIINIPTGIWMNFCVDVLGFVTECFKGQSFRAIDSICLSADCKIRKICGMRQLYTVLEDDYLQLGEESSLPKGFLFPKGIQYVNVNFDMKYIKNTVDVKNIKNNNNIPKTSQSSRATKNLKSLEKEVNKKNNTIHFEGRKIGSRSKSINNQVKKNVMINNNNNNDPRIDEIKNYLKDSKNKKSIEKNKPKILNNNNKTKSNKNNSLKNDIKKSNKGKYQIKDENINNNIMNIHNQSKTNNQFQLKNNKNSDISPFTINNIIPNKNMIQNSNNNYVNDVQKENPFFNTFNYNQLESKENTLLGNQSNFINASMIPEVVDLDINNTYLKNNENDLNKNDIIFFEGNSRNFNIDNNNNNKKEPQMDSMISDGIISSMNFYKNERPYTPPIQKILPENDGEIKETDNDTSKINESIIKNHYCDLVYDNEKGKYYDTKLKIFYDFK